MIQTTEVSITYKGDGVQTSFPYPYPYRSSDDIVGYIINDVGYEKRITNNFKYDKVSNIYQYPLAGEPLAAPYSIKLIRETPQQQNADLPGKLPFSLIEKSLDWIIMILQEIGSRCNSLWHIRNDCKLSETNARNSASAAAESEENAANSEDMAKKWAMSPVSPDGVVDTNSPTGYTQSAKIWAALSKEYAGLSKFKLPIGYYNSVDEMRASETAIVGRPCVTLGYYEPNDGGGAVYIIRSKTNSDVDDGGSIIVLDNGNVAELIIEGAVNVRQFGAKGDGTTDDTTAIQHAINAYNQVAIPPGEYIFTTLTLKSNLKLIGMGGTLKLKDDVCTDTTKYYQIIWSDSSNENVTLDGLIINGNADNNSSYKVADAITICGTHCSIRNCTILNAPDSGIMFSQAINSTCEGNYIKGFRDCGIYVNNNDKANQKLGSIVSKNIIVAAAQSGITGIALKRICQQIQVVNNTIRNCQYGITHEQASTDSDFSTDTVVSGNVIIDNSNMSIILRGSANCVCSNNYIYSTSATAIRVESCQNCTISNNAIVQTYGDITSSISIIGIDNRKGFSSSDSITVVGNTIKINYASSTSTIYAFRVIGTSTDPANRISIIGNTVAYTYTSTKSDNAMLFRLSYVTSSIVTANTISGASRIGDIDQDTDSVVVNNQGDNYNTSLNGKILITRMINGRAIYLLTSSAAPSFAAATSDIALAKYPATVGCIGYVYDGAAWKKFGAITT